LSFAAILGLVAGAITTGSLVPQVIRVFQLKSARDVSLLFTVLLLVGDAAWLVYGILLKELPLILWNILAVAFMSVLLYGKVKYSRTVCETKEPARTSKSPMA
jgi:MtN3 and saliva related transmembrane protein